MITIPHPNPVVVTVSETIEVLERFKNYDFNEKVADVVMGYLEDSMPREEASQYTIEVSRSFNEILRRLKGFGGGDFITNRLDLAEETDEGDLQVAVRSSCTDTRTSIHLIVYDDQEGDLIIDTTIITWIKQRDLGLGNEAELKGDQIAFKV
jgi:hypothetical protein